jgi:hypothetical protein
MRDTSSLHKTETQRRIQEHSSGDDESSVISAKEKDGDGDGAVNGETTYEEIRGGIPYEHDVEAAKPELEKKKSSTSTRDPNLVSFPSIMYWYGMRLTFIGDMGLCGRPCKPQKLVDEAQMGCYAHRVVLHARIAHFVVYDFARYIINHQGFQHYE